MDVMSNENFALSGNNKDQFRDLHNYLNQKVTTAINNVDDYTLGDNITTSHQVDYMSSALLPAEVVKNSQEHLVAIRSVESRH